MPAEGYEYNSIYAPQLFQLDGKEKYSSESHLSKYKVESFENTSGLPEKQNT